MKIRHLLVSLTAALAAASVLAKPELASAPEKIAPLAVGAVAPTFKLKTEDNSDFDLAKAYKEKPTVVVFYKAAWCGLGAKNLGQLTQGESKFNTLGYQIIAISTDKPEDLHPTKLKHGLSYTLLSDSGLQAAPAYGVAYRASQELIDSYKEKKITLAQIPGEKDGSSWLLVPTVFIVGRDGQVKWAYSSQKENPALTDLLNAAEWALK